MKINSILLYNFGSYEGETLFDTRPTADGKNIVLIGGKNGAGKTTLFTAMRVCLYGYMSMGYKNANSHYNRAIIKLINNNAKIRRPANAHVEMQIGLSNGHEVDLYTLRREWTLGETLSEKFSVAKNEAVLAEDAVADFEKYLLTLIPPELFNLYFFDGEKIADFFLEEGSNARIKDAFLTLCGYDTFEIMRKNFKRIGSGKTNGTPDLDEYLAAKEALGAAQQTQQELTARLNQCIDEMDTCDADIVALEKAYHQSGGVSQEEWNQKLLTIKEEEKKRETYNALLRKWANEMIPFLMVRDQIAAIKRQIEKENSTQKYHNFCEVLEKPAVRRLVKGDLSAIIKAAAAQFSESGDVILDLSLEQSALLLSHINQVLDFDVEKIAKSKRAIKRSLTLTAKIRQELDSSSVSSVQEYMQKRAQMFETKSALLVQRIELERQLAENKEVLQQAETQLSRVQSRLEEELKQASITDISARAIIMLDKLQHSLYRRQIEKVEAFFRKEIKILMRKSRFIDDIRIDDEFNTHIYRNEEIQISRLLESLRTNTEAQLASMFGSAAMQELQKKVGSSEISAMIRFFTDAKDETIVLPVEIDKTSLSNGEKQIFIMALYHSLVQLCNHEIPFIIDTPFARIDTEHRRNISTHFFCKLKGQVFILSTNEEINSAHVQIMGDHIAATYMLENTDNKRTTVVSNKYFEV